MLKPDLHIGNVIAARIQEIGMTKAEFGRRISTSRQNVNTVLRKESLDGHQLFMVSMVLGIDLFAFYQKKLPEAIQETGGFQKPPINEIFSLTISSLDKMVIDRLLAWMNFE